MERYWLVWVGDTVVNPQEPLDYEDAIKEFRRQVRENGDEKVEIQQCSATELEWAGIGRRKPRRVVTNIVTGPVTGMVVMAGRINGEVRL